MCSHQFRTPALRWLGLATLSALWSVSAQATDFALEGNTLTVTNASADGTLLINSEGNATSVPTIPVSSTDFGMPDFSLGLELSSVDVGEHVFWAAVEIQGSNNDKYLRAFLDEIFITVNADGSFQGEVRPTTNLTVRVESEGEFLQIELDDQAGDSVSFAGDTLRFNAGNLLTLLGAADGNSALWQALSEDFNSSDNFTYGLYLGPRDYGVQGARVGISAGGGFTPFPLRPAAFLGNEEVYVIQGSFNSSAASDIDQALERLPILSSVVGSPGADAVTIRGGVSANGSADFFRQAAFSIGESIAVQFLISPAPAHVGLDAVLVVGLVLDSDPGTLYLLSAAGELQPFDGQQVDAYAQVNLATHNLLEIPPGGPVLLSDGLQGSYQFFTGYLLQGSGEVFYSADPVVLEVN